MKLTIVADGEEFCTWTSPNDSEAWEDNDGEKAEPDMRLALNIIRDDVEAHKS